MRTSTIVGAGMVGLGLVCAGLLLGERLHPARSAEFSEDALRRGLHHTIAPQTAPLAQMLDLAHETSPISAIRDSSCAKKQPYVSPFASSDRRADMTVAKQRAAAVLSGHWKGVDLTRQDDSAYMANLSRGERYKVNAFEFLDDLMLLIEARSESSSEQRRFLLYSANRLSDYASRHFFAGNDYRTDHGGSGDFTWYDMGAGQRASLVGFTLSRAACDSRVSDETIETLVRFAADHLYYLGTDRYFVENNNHGLYQSIGLISLCKYFPPLKGCRIATDIAIRRLTAIMNDDFVHGFHKEHSPSYQEFMVVALSALSSLLPRGSPLSDRLLDLYNDAYDKLAWFVRPDRTLAPFGDTDQKRLSLDSEGVSTGAMPGSLRWILSDGKEGKPPRSPLLTDSAAGYGVVRFVQPDGHPSEASYLALSAAFHSRTHKHADDLNFVWSEGQQNILIDSGRYAYARKAPPTPAMKAMGFWYDDPKRMYVESTHAHNTIEMDGESIPRTDHGAYGSALGTGFEAEPGLYVLQAAVTREDGAFHRRVLVLDVTVGLLVLDSIHGGDGDVHDFTQWFHFGPEYEMAEKAEGVTVTSGRDRIQVLSAGVRDIVADRGRTEPRLSGWYSPGGAKLEPNLAIGFRRAGRAAWYGTVFNRTMRTLTTVEVERDQASDLPSSLTLCFADGRVLKYTFTTGQQGGVIAVKREEDG
jgi:hypothetical protein